MRLVSVIIPCFKQAHYLGEAIESALAQTYPCVEVVVVDDGSPDDTAAVSASYEGVRYVRQANRGLAAARNAGFAASSGEYVVFLDADDRLLPNALVAGAEALDANTACPFVFGRRCRIAADGSPLPSAPDREVEGDHYLHLLRGNYIHMPAMVMYRRTAVEAAGGFDASINASADYDLYLRLSRTAPVHAHGVLVAEYRQHEANMSTNSIGMLRTSLAVLRAQWPRVRGDARYEAAYREGMRRFREYYGDQLFNEARARMRSGAWLRGAQDTLLLLRYSPLVLARRAGAKLSRSAPRL